MELPITTPALLFPAIAILMLGYINRYVSTASVIRNYKRDHDSGLVRKDILMQLNVLRKRIELSRYMIMTAAGALIFACLSMFLIFIEYKDGGSIAFGFALAGMIISIGISIYETSLSNRSLLMEIDKMIEKE